MPGNVAMLNSPRLAPLLFALSLAACAAPLTTSTVDAPPAEPMIATGDAGPTDPPPDDPDLHSPTLPLPPPREAVALLAR